MLRRLISWINPPEADKCRLNANTFNHKDTKAQSFHEDIFKYEYKEHEDLLSQINTSALPADFGDER